MEGSGETLYVSAQSKQPDAIRPGLSSPAPSKTGRSCSRGVPSSPSTLGKVAVVGLALSNQLGVSTVAARLLAPQSFPAPSSLGSASLVPSRNPGVTPAIPAPSLVLPASRVSPSPDPKLAISLGPSWPCVVPSADDVLLFNPNLIPVQNCFDEAGEVASRHVEYVDGIDSWSIAPSLFKPPSGRLGTRLAGPLTVAGVPAVDDITMTLDPFPSTAETLVICPKEHLSGLPVGQFRSLHQLGWNTSSTGEAAPMGVYTAAAGSCSPAMAPLLVQSSSLHNANLVELPGFQGVVADALVEDCSTFKWPTYHVCEDAGAWRSFPEDLRQLEGTSLGAARHWIDDDSDGTQDHGGTETAPQGRSLLESNQASNRQPGTAPGMASPTAKLPAAIAHNPSPAAKPIPVAAAPASSSISASPEEDLNPTSTFQLIADLLRGQGVLADFITGPCADRILESSVAVIAAKLIATPLGWHWPREAEYWAAWSTIFVGASAWLIKVVTSLISGKASSLSIWWLIMVYFFIAQLYARQSIKAIPAEAQPT